VELPRWDFLQEKSPILDAEDVERILITRDSIDALVVDSQMQELENILGSNGTPKWN
jgi:hypothetical protein